MLHKGYYLQRYANLSFKDTMFSPLVPFRLNLPRSPTRYEREQVGKLQKILIIHYCVHRVIIIRIPKKNNIINKNNKIANNSDP